MCVCVCVCVYCIVGYYSPNIIRVVTERKMRWARNVARIGENRNACRILVGKLVVKGSLGSLRHRQDGRNKWILEKQSGVVWAGFEWLRTGRSFRPLLTRC